MLYHNAKSSQKAGDYPRRTSIMLGRRRCQITSLSNYVGYPKGDGDQHTRLNQRSRRILYNCKARWYALLHSHGQDPPATSPVLVAI